jgi:hypothetical protein
MFIVKASLRQLFRRKLRSLVVLVVSLVIVLFLNVYTNTIYRHRQTLDELHANIEVTGYITDLDGNIDGLRIERKIITGLENTGFIRDGIYTLRVFGKVGTWQDGDISRLTDYTRNPSMLVGVNDVTALPQQPEFMDGYDEKLFGSEEKVCLVSEDFLADHSLFVGAEVNYTALDIKKYPAESESDISRHTVSLKIVGVYKSYVTPAPIYCPLEIANDVSRGIGKPVEFSSANFLLQNTQDLNRFRDTLMEFGFVSRGAGSVSGSQELSFTINDRLLKNATAPVQDYIDFSRALYPVIYLFCAGIGFLVSYLLIRVRKPEFAIMRSLGTSRTVSFFTFFVEQGILCLLGTALGLVISVLMTGQFSVSQVGTGLGYVSFYLTGSGLGIATMNRVNVIEILTARE